ncbi:SPOR domain-containing protein [Guyparkeria sp.]|uniref:SPOR domain-containing protein n=1 Tax=Guyparkeria sp. TaxID=2035736 RepID=UPI0035696A8A
MSNATEHALEQAERIVQYSKYSDRFLVVEGDNPAERRAFVKLISQKLPPQVRPVVVRADGSDDITTVIDRLSTNLQLSAGIETPEQLVTATTAALEDQGRLLLIVENAEQWLDSDAASTLFELIDQAHELARERMLFMLVGGTDLCTRIETAQPLAAILADLHCVQLLGTEPASATPAAAPVTDPQPAETVAPHPAASVEATDPRTAGSPGPRRARRNEAIWAHPPFLIAAAVSVAVITIGIFALMSRSEPPAAPDEVELAVDRPSGGEEREGNAPGSTGPAAGDEAESPSDTYGQPLHVPFPDDQDTPSRSTTDTPAVAEEASAPATADADDAPPTEEAQTSATDDDSRPGEEPETAAADDDAAESGASSDTAVNNAWFRDQPRARAAIQLAAFGSLDGARGMIRTRSDEALPAGEWRIYTQRVSGQTLYTVTYGDFASVERARHAIESLPEELRTIAPYPRSVGDIQDRLVD